MGRVISSGVRSGRRARATLSSRLGWLGAIANLSGVAAVINIALALYSVIVFAALAGMLGAFFLEETKSGYQRET